MQFYNWLYSKHSNWRPKFDGISFNSIGVHEGPWMERAFEESDVLEVVRDLNSDKYPGP